MFVPIQAGSGSLTRDEDNCRKIKHERFSLLFFQGVTEASLTEPLLFGVPTRYNDLVFRSDFDESVLIALSKCVKELFPMLLVVILKHVLHLCFWVKIILIGDSCVESAQDRGLTAL